MAQRINRLGMVAFDHLAAERCDAPLSPADAEHALAVLDQHSCDTVLFALGWQAAAEVKPDWTNLRVVQSVITGKGDSDMTLHQRGLPARELTAIDLSYSRRDDATKAQVVEALPDRIFNGATCLFGGEVNAFTMVKLESRFIPPAGWQQALDAHDVRLILNPSPTYMRRWEMKRKRAFISSRGRTVVSLWNRTTVGESYRPWTVFQDGTEVTGAAHEVDTDDERLTLAILDVPPVRATY